MLWSWNWDDHHSCIFIVACTESIDCHCCVHVCCFHLITTGANYIFSSTTGCKHHIMFRWRFIGFSLTCWFSFFPKGEKARTIDLMWNNVWAVIELTYAYLFPFKPNTHRNSRTHLAHKRTCLQIMRNRWVLHLFFFASKIIVRVIWKHVFYSRNYVKRKGNSLMWMKLIKQKRRTLCGFVLIELFDCFVVFGSDNTVTRSACIIVQRYLH